MAMVIAATMLFLVGLMHSILGGRRLVNPIVRRDDLPVILGDIEISRVTLYVGWHLLTLFWWGQAAALLIVALDLAPAQTAFLAALSVCAGLSGVLAVILSRGKHLSWVFFLPLSFVTGWAAWGG